MELQWFRELVIKSAQEDEEFLVTMPWKTLTDDFAFQYFQSGEECRCSVPHVIMSQCATATLLEWQTWLRTV